MTIFVIGNIGTGKSTIGKYIADKHNYLLLDDDDIYYTLGNHSWKHYYNEEIQKTIDSMIASGLILLEDKNFDVVVTSARIDLYNKLQTFPSYRYIFILLGNKTQKQCVKNRMTNSRGKPAKAWKACWSKLKPKIDYHIELVRSLKGTNVKIIDLTDHDINDPEIYSIIDRTLNSSKNIYYSRKGY